MRLCVTVLVGLVLVACSTNDPNRNVTVGECRAMDVASVVERTGLDAMDALDLLESYGCHD